MASRRGVFLGVAVAAFLFVACASTPLSTTGPETIVLATQPEFTGNSCPTALGVGRLVPHPVSGLAIAGPNGGMTQVMWPHGFSARLVDGQIELLNQHGVFVAREGDTVEFGGGMGGAGQVFWVCPAEVTRVSGQ